MKLLLFLTLGLPYIANAIELVKFQSDPETSSRQKFVLEDKTLVYEKESNLFDVSKNYTLGTFKLAASPETKAKLEEILGQIKSTDEILKSKGLSFNELSSSSNHHDVRIMLADFQITKNSNFYAELDKVFTELLSKKMTHEKGIALSADLTKISHFANGKKVKTEDFSLKFSCQKETLPTVCRIKKEGYLFIGTK